VVHRNTRPIYFARARLTQSGLRIVMAPPVRFQADHLSYDSVANKLRGQSWSHVEFCSNLKHLLAGSCCYANDDRTKIFFCGGTRRVNGYFDSTSGGLFDINTGKMTELLSMPHGHGDPRIVCVHSKIYAFQVGHNTLCYSPRQAHVAELLASGRRAGIKRRRSQHYCCRCCWVWFADDGPSLPP
jgi:hypothetical protein